MQFWNTFAAKHPAAAKWVREGGLFVIVSNLITVFKYLLLQFLPAAFSSLPVVDFGWPGIPVTLFGETFQWNILGYDAAHGGRNDHFGLIGRDLFGESRHYLGGLFGMHEELGALHVRIRMPAAGEQEMAFEHAARFFIALKYFFVCHQLLPTVYVICDHTDSLPMMSFMSVMPHFSISPGRSAMMRGIA